MLPSTLESVSHGSVGNRDRSAVQQNDAVDEFGEIANERLRRDHLPSPSDDQMAWIDFALTFDGYAAKGDACAKFAERTRKRWESSDALPSELSDLRSALFFEQRRWRWGDEGAFTPEEWRYWSALVDAMRDHLPPSE